MQDFKHADLSIAEGFLRLENHWLKMESQVTFLEKVWADLPGDLQIHYEKIMSVLRSKLQSSLDELNRLRPTQIISDATKSTVAAIRYSSRSKVKFAASVKKVMETSLTEIQTWQVTFSLSWSQLAQLKGDHMDSCLSTAQSSGPINELRRLRETLKHEQNSETSSTTVFLSAETAVAATHSRIQFSSLICWEQRAPSRLIISDVRTVETPPDINTQTKDIRNIARLLKIPHPSIAGVPTCQGVVKRYNRDQGGVLVALELLFELPGGSRNLRSLRQMLIEADPSYPLNKRIDLAKHISRSVMAMHTWQFVHKTIRPDNVLVVQTPIDGDIGYLMGYERFRQIDNVSIMKRGDDFWDKNIYRHPNRQGVCPNEDYVMQHDIYSLGVVLLEIGLWQSFVQWPAPDLFSSDASTSTATPTSAINIADALKIHDSRARAFTIKKEMVSTAEKIRPGKTGQRYAEVVVSCLTCLDANNERFGDEKDFYDEDGILVGVRYIEKVHAVQIKMSDKC